MSRGVLALLISMAVGLAVLLYAWTRPTPTVPVDEDKGSAISQVLSSHFATTNALQVATLSGDVQTLAHDDRLGGLLHSRQATRFPYTVDYFIDLSKLTPDAYRWDAMTRTMTVEIGDVTVARPNIDSSRAATDRRGIFITRAAFDAMSKQVAAKAITVSGAEAKKPENLDKARNSARVKVAALASSPLIAAGFGDVKVRVRFPWEPRDGGRPVNWNESRSLGQVYGNAN